MYKMVRNKLERRNDLVFWPIPHFITEQLWDALTAASDYSLNPHTINEATSPATTDLSHEYEDEVDKGYKVPLC